MSYHISRYNLGAWTAFGALDSNLSLVANQAMSEIRSDADVLRSAANAILLQQDAGSSATISIPGISFLFDALTAGRPEAANAALTAVSDAESFLATTAPNLLARANAGDENALVALASAAQNIRDAIQDVAKDISANISLGAFVQRFIDEVVKKTGKQIIPVANTLLYVTLGVALTALFLRIRG